jgi:hypothetical protein
MRALLLPAVIILLGWYFGSCSSSTAPAPFCDTTCQNDSLKYNLDHPDHPFVYLSVKNCKPDTLTWSHDQLSTNRKSGFYELVGKDVRLNKNYISCSFKDTSYAWLKFNDCVTGRGFLVKLPYSKSDKWSIYTSALNSFDPKFKVDEGLIAYYDDTFIYVQDPQTGKTEKMVMADKKLDIDYNDVHKTIDSVNISRTKIWANLTIDGQTKPKDKTISLE